MTKHKQFAAAAATTLLGLLALNDVPAQCPHPAVLTYHETTYALVNVGMQCWFAENLSTTRFADGRGLLVVDAVQWAELSSNNLPQTGVVTRKGRPVGEGRIYNAAAILDPAGLCPVGWHVPSDGDWNRLEMALGLSAAEVEKTGFRGGHADQLRMESPRYEEWNGLNAFGFSALPGGFRGADGGDWNWGDSGFWWSSTPWHGGGALWMRSISNWGTGVYRSTNPQGNGLSVRCLKD